MSTDYPFLILSDKTGRYYCVPKEDNLNNYLQERGYYADIVYLEADPMWDDIPVMRPIDASSYFIVKKSNYPPQIQICRCTNVALYGYSPDEGYILVMYAEYAMYYSISRKTCFISHIDNLELGFVKQTMVLSLTAFM